MRPPIRRTAVLAAAALVLSLTACTGDDDDEPDGTPAPVGAVVPTLGFEIEGFPSHVVVPGRRFDFVISSPRDRMSSVAAGDASFDDEAGEGSAFIGVRWSQGQVPGQAAFVMVPPQDLPVTATLLVDGERRDLGDLLAEGANGAYVVVPEDVDEIGLEVEYDGRVQVLDDVEDPVLGRPRGIDALYNDAPTLTRPAVPDTVRQGRLSWGGGSYDATVSSAVPYYGPVGWADPDTAWVTARVVIGSADLAGVDTAQGNLNYDVTGAEATLTLDGREPEDVLPANDGETAGLQTDGTWKGIAVFRVGVSEPLRELVVARTYRADARNPDDVEAAGEPRVRTLRDRVVVPVS